MRSIIFSIIALVLITSGCSEGENPVTPKPQPAEENWVQFYLTGFDEHLYTVEYTIGDKSYSLENQQGDVEITVKDAEFKTGDPVFLRGISPTADTLYVGGFIVVLCNSMVVRDVDQSGKTFDGSFELSTTIPASGYCN
jgi:hypothetical protein